MIMSSDFVDTAAHVIALTVIVLVPILGITVFWLVHILPEKIAEKRHHPQKDAIKTLCLLSLVFGGLFWPLAWLWAYSKPVLHKMAYGTDKHEDYYELESSDEEAVTLTHEPVVPEHARDAQAAADGLHEEITRLRQRLDELEGRGLLLRATEGIHSWKS
jgi:CBS domain containing-hemolysin-like protein